MLITFLACKFHSFSAVEKAEVFTFFYIVAQQPKTGQDRLIFRFLDHTQLDTQTHTRLDSSERVISSSQRPLPARHTTNTRGEHIHVLSGI